MVSICLSSIDDILIRQQSRSNFSIEDGLNATSHSFGSGLNASSSSSQPTPHRSTPSNSINNTTLQLPLLSSWKTYQMPPTLPIDDDNEGGSSVVEIDKTIASSDHLDICGIKCEGP